MLVSRIIVFVLLFSTFFLFPSLPAQNPRRIDSMEKELKTAKDDTNKASTLYRLGYNLRYDTRNDKALRYQKEGLALSKKLDFVRGVSVSYRNLGFIYLNRGDIPLALNYFDSCVTYSRRRGYRTGEAMGYLGMGWAMTDIGRSAEGISNYRKALAIYEEISDKEGIENIYIIMGNNYFVTGNYPEALRAYLSTLRSAEKRGNKNGIDDAYFGLALVYTSQRNFSEALNYYLKLLPFYESQGDTLNIAYIYNNMGVIYEDMKDYPQALHFFSESYKMKDAMGDYAGTEEALANAGEVYMLQGDFGEAIRYLEAAIKINQQSKSVITRGRLYIAFGNALLKKAIHEKADAVSQKYLKAAGYLRKGIQVASEVKDIESQKNGYLYLAVYDSVLGDYRSALQHHKLFVMYKDSLLSEESQNRLSQIKMDYETEKRDREITLLAQEKKLKEEQVALLRDRNKVNFTIMLASVAGFVLLLVVIIFIVRSRRKLKKAYDLVNRQKERIAEVLGKLEATNVKLEETNQELEAFSYSVSHDLRAPVRRIEGLSDMLREDYEKVLDDAGKDLLSRITGSSVLMNQLIEDMLKLSRITRYTVSKTTCSLSEMAAKICGDLKLAYPGHEVTCRIEDGIIVEADPNLLQIALQNLLDNAWKYSSKAESPEVTVGREMKDGKKVIFIRDNGVGFDMSQAGKLFTPFQRLHSDDQFKGTGIGLATVKRIIVKHGGTISAHSEPGKGTIFYFTLE